MVLHMVPLYFEDINIYSEFVYKYVVLLEKACYTLNKNYLIPVEKCVHMVYGNPKFDYYDRNKLRKLLGFNK